MTCFIVMILDLEKRETQAIEGYYKYDDAASACEHFIDNGYIAWVDGPILVR